jgi:hypothetical protein
MTKPGKSAFDEEEEYEFYRARDPIHPLRNDRLAAQCGDELGCFVRHWSSAAIPRPSGKTPHRVYQ